MLPLGPPRSRAHATTWWREHALGGARRAAIAAGDRAWLAAHWAEVTRHEDVSGVALAAVGSVGRGDAGPLSDYDLLLLHDGRRRAGDLEDLANRLWYPLWDSGIRLDHSVRTVAQCRATASGDLAAALGLLDIAVMAGDPRLVDEASQTLAHDWRSNARTRLAEVLDNLEERHRRAGDLSQSTEPDLKEARGGLRDMTVLTALTRAWLADRPHGGVDAAYSHLLDVRDALHVASGRARERMTHEDQESVATLLGHSEVDDMLTEVLGAGRVVAYALDATVRRARQSQGARRLRIGPRRPTMTPLGHGLHLHDGEVVLGSPSLADDPLTPLRAAVAAARAGVPIAPATLTRLAASPAVPQPWGAAARELLTDLLAAGPGLPVVWEGLDQVGLITQWIPEWAAVRSRPQRSRVHRHTVDRHCVETAVEAAALVRSVARPDLLVMAALIHDIGKVAGADDHSRVGAASAEVIGQRWGLPEADRQVVVTLVREHLTLMDLATRRDHSDPATIAAVLAAVGADREVLDLLAALTEADARAAGPLAWTTWRSRLLQDLVGAVRAAMTQREAAGATPAVSLLDPAAPHATLVRVDPVAGGWAVTVQAVDRVGLFADMAGALAVQGLMVRRAQLATVDTEAGAVAVDVWDVEGDEHQPPDPAAIGALIDRLGRGEHAVLDRLRRRSRAASAPAGLAPRVLLAPDASSDATALEVRTDDRPGLVHDLGRALASVGISVRSAHIATSAGQAMDTLYLLDRDGSALAPARVAQAVAALMEACESAP